VNERREVELKSLRNRFFVLTMATGTWLAVPLIITAISFFFYTVVERKPLLPSTAFTALTLIGLLRIPLDRIAVALAQIQQAKASIDRIQAFFDENATLSPYEFSDDCNGPYVGFDHARLSWDDGFSSNKESSLGSNSSFQLVDIDIDFYKGGLNIITGPTGSGKSTLLTGLLGELSLLEGSVHLPRCDGIAYCAQEAWLLNQTVKENIVFSSPLDDDRYQTVVEACALTRDLETLPEGDQTSVSDRGLVLSGGQKQRISLARAVYSNAMNLLLDDCLSAVDSNTAQHIFTQLFLGPLMVNRTIILVTHGIALCAPRAQHIVILDNGRIAAQGSYDSLVASKHLKDGMQPRESLSDSSTPTLPSTPRTGGQATPSVDVSHLGILCEPEIKSTQQAASDHAIINVDDHSETLKSGAMSWNAMKLYLDQMGPWYHWIGILVAFTAETIAIVATNNWIRTWSSAYHAAENADYPKFASNRPQSHFLAPGAYPDRIAFENWRSRTSFNMATLQEVSNSYYLWIYGSLAFTYVLAYVCRAGLVFKGSLNASRSIQRKLLASVLSAQFAFFDTTPVGEIVNR
jgi:ABC-type multidrug transport system fused ATPase/permease subunit